MPTILREIDLPDFGVPEARPELSRDVHAARIVRFADRIRALGLDAAVVYADREHFANLAYLCGFDPRFEEALLVFAPGRYPGKPPSSGAIPGRCSPPRRCRWRGSRS